MQHGAKRDGLVAPHGEHTVAVPQEHERAILDAGFVASQDAIGFTRARDERVADVNDAWCRTTRCARENVIGRDQRTLRFRRDAEGSARRAAYIGEHGSADGFEFACTRRLLDGRTEVGHAVRTAQTIALDGVGCASRPRMPSRARSIRCSSTSWSTRAMRWTPTTAASWSAPARAR